MAKALFVGRNRLDTLVEVDGEATVRGLTPDLAVLATLPGRGFMVTAAAGSGTAADFVSRFFAPGIGIDEDPEAYSQPRKPVTSLQVRALVA